MPSSSQNNHRGNQLTPTDYQTQSYIGNQTSPNEQNRARVLLEPTAGENRP
jgi:hypothetical protein